MRRPEEVSYDIKVLQFPWVFQGDSGVMDSLKNLIFVRSKQSLTTNISPPPRPSIEDDVSFSPGVDVLVPWRVTFLNTKKRRFQGENLRFNCHSFSGSTTPPPGRLPAGLLYYFW